ncbi:la-related protein 7 [Centruroides vittatus]|uniref:la-related protein 7 n=1 Tax=Centruroides vittatus TaxID=120091 RepID=UPI003510ADF3
MKCEEQICEEGEIKAEKKIRRRTTNLYKAIREQMEFYFSDSNLLRDKFLQQTISDSKDGYIDIELFMKFNKIRALTKESRDVANAVSSSSIIKLNEDKTKLKRILPVTKRENIDDCMIYVERLPSGVDHDWLKSVFSNFGTVLYVSLPRFKPTGKPKGFSFIEFETPESVKRACQYFMNHNDEMERQEIMYEDLTSMDTVIQSSEIENEKDMKENVLKRKQNEENEMEVQAKRQKVEECEDVSNKELLKSEKHKKKKHRKRDKHKKKAKQEIEIDDLALRVMSKREWKSWKNKYLSLQKKAMAEVKQKLFLNNNSKVNNNNKTEQINEEIDKINKVEEDIKCKNTLNYQPGVIIKVNCENPITEVSKFKAKINQLGNVAYVDVNKDTTMAYIRCQSAEDATKILQNSQEDIGQMDLLTGIEEQSYWEKIKNDKEKSYRSRKKTRGRTKIITKVEKTIKNTHIRFDD